MSNCSAWSPTKIVAYAARGSTSSSQASTDSVLIFADNSTYTSWTSLQLGFVRKFEHHLEAIRALHTFHSIPHILGDIGQRRFLLQVWPGCNQTPRSLDYHLLERPLQRNWRSIQEYGRNALLFHRCASCVTDYPERTESGTSLLPLQCTTQGLPVLAYADRFWTERFATLGSRGLRRASGQTSGF